MFFFCLSLPVSNYIGYRRYSPQVVAVVVVVVVVSVAVATWDG